MTAPKVDLSDVVRRVELVDVRLMSANVATKVRDVKVLERPQLLMRHGAKVIARSENSFLVGAMLTAQIAQGREADAADGLLEDPDVRMSVTFSLEYKLPDAASADDSVLNEFARVNGAFNAWPYWREYVQTTASRMSLPPLILPVFRVERPKPPTPPIETHVRARRVKAGAKKK